MSESMIRDLRDNYGRFDHEAYDEQAKIVGAIAWAIYTGLCRYASSKDGTAWPGYKRLASDLDLSEKTVRVCLGKLSRAKLIEIEARNDPSGRIMSNLYTILPLECGSTYHASGNGYQRGVVADTIEQDSLEPIEDPKGSSGESNPAKNPKSKKPAKEKSASVYTTEIKNKLSEICFGRTDGWKTQASGLGKALRELAAIEPDLSVEKLTEFEARYKKDAWRWTLHHQRPETYQVVSEWLKYMPGEGSNATTEPTIDWDKVDWDKIPSIPSNAAGGKLPDDWGQPKPPSYDSTHLDHILDDDEEVPF